MSGAKSLTDLRALIGRCNNFLANLMVAAAQNCRRLAHREIYPEHLLQAALDEPGSDVLAILAHAGIDEQAVRQELRVWLSRLPATGLPRPPFSEVLVDALERAWYRASVQERRAAIRSGDVLWALLESSASGRTYALEFIRRQLPAAQLSEEFAELVANSMEDAEPVDAGEERAVTSPAGTGTTPDAPGSAAPAAEPGSRTSFISKYCTNFTKLAEEGKLDPVFGRDAEIRAVLDCLGRRRKNNPILVGEPGVGKTAIVEGLALRIRDGDVPAHFVGCQVIGLDLGLLQAGASVKGEFERRLKGLIDEIKTSPIPTISFIDEAHTLIGAGNLEGGADAANLLKPALARGELRAIAATTWSEYKKYFETDPALTRRFQLIHVHEPSEEDAATMLRGLRTRYEQAHSVRILDEAITASVRCAKRYVTGRFLPDSAIDLIDTAAAKLNNVLQSKPAAIDQMERDLGDIEIARRSLVREVEEGRKEARGPLAEVDKRKANVELHLQSLRSRWQVEREKVEAIHDTARLLSQRREEMEAARRDLDWEHVAALESGPLAELGARMSEQLSDLHAVQGDAPLLYAEVDAKMIGAIVQEWTGVPVNQLLRDEAERALKLEEELKARIRGQDFAVRQIVEALKARQAGVGDPDRPIGVFLCLGPSGTGKTESALAVADIMFGGEQFVTKINMSEYGADFDESRLIGAPPGYVGYGKGGVLTEAVRQKPYSVVVLDEVDRAAEGVWNLFYSPFERGTMSDGEGRLINFRNTCVFLTSNLGSEIIEAWCERVNEAGQEPSAAKAGCDETKGAPTASGGETTNDGKPTVDDLLAALRARVARVFSQPLMARMSVVPFLPLDRQALVQVAGMKLDQLARRLKSQREITFEWTEAVPGWIADCCTQSGMGARLIDQILRTRLMPDLTNQLLVEMASGREPKLARAKTPAEGATDLIVALE